MTRIWVGCGQVDERRLVTTALDHQLRRTADLAGQLVDRHSHDKVVPPALLSSVQQAAALAVYMLDAAPDGDDGTHAHVACDFDGWVEAMTEDRIGGGVRVLWACPACGYEHEETA